MFVIVCHFPGKCWTVQNSKVEPTKSTMKSADMDMDLVFWYDSIIIQENHWAWVPMSQKQRATSRAGKSHDHSLWTQRLLRPETWPHLELVYDLLQKLLQTKVPTESEMGVFQLGKWGYQFSSLVGSVSWKIPAINGWCLGVALFRETSIWSKQIQSLWVGTMWTHVASWNALKQYMLKSWFQKQIASYNVVFHLHSGDMELIKSHCLCTLERGASDWMIIAWIVIWCRLWYSLCMFMQ